MSDVAHGQAPVILDRRGRRGRVRRITVGGRHLVAKSASGAARRQLRREAELLEQLGDLAVVQLVALRESDDRTDLVTSDAGRHSLSHHPGVPPSVLLRAVTGAAESLRSLHAAGWVHGAVCSDHVVVDHTGRATWCSLASARPTAADPSGVGADLLQFRSMVDGLAASRDPQWSVTQWWRFRRAVRTIAPLGTVPARNDALARQDLSTSRRSDVGPSTEVGDPRRWSRSAIGLVVGAAAIGATALMWGATDRAAGRPDLGGPPRSCAPADPRRDVDVDLDGCADEVTVDGELLTVGSTTYRVGRAGDQIALASVPCGTAPRVLLLRPSDGSLHVFDEWPSPGSGIVARRVADGLSDTRLTVEQRPDCRQPWLVHADGSREAPVTTPRPTTADSGLAPPSSTPTEEHP